MKQLDLTLATPKRINVDRVIDERAGVQFFGEAVQQFDGSYVCFADVGGAMCVVKVSIPQGEEKR